MPVADRADGFRKGPSSIIGLQEDDELDFKSEPYLLASPDETIKGKARLELAKDVSAFLNTRGGIILIGVTTSVDPASQVECASALTPIPQQLINLKQIRDVLREYVYPQPRFNIELIHEQLDGSAICMLVVEQGTDRDMPYIVIRERAYEKGAAKSILSIYERQATDNVPMRPEHIHVRLHQAWDQLDLVGGAHLDLMGEALDSEARQVLDLDREACRLLEDGLHYYLQFVPMVSERLFNYNEGDEPDLESDLMRFTPTRPMGFGLRGTSKIERLPAHGLVRAVFPGSYSLSISKYGLVTAVQAGRRVTWATADRGFPKPTINPLAVVEFNYDVCRVVKEIVAARSPSSMATCRVILGVHGQFQEIHLPTGWPADSFAIGWEEPTKSPPFEVATRVTKPRDPGRDAYQVTKAFYDHFQLGAKLIPFVRDSAVDPDCFPGR
jgi:schlafen family protein